jgi:hypothetical protein
MAYADLMFFLSLGSRVGFLFVTKPLELYFFYKDG